MGTISRSNGSPRPSPRHAAPWKIALLLCALTGCASPVANASGPSAPGFAPAATRAARWIPAAGTSYQIQYDGTLDTNVAADTYDVDLFDTTSAQVAALHARGRHAVCYISVGTWENWRPDAKTFPAKVLGKPDGGWPGERWLDVRQTSILEPIMAKRFELCRAKGFDGADPDNIDGYQNATGFPLTAGEQLTYDAWVAGEAHSLGLTVAQKNDGAQVAQLSRLFDYAVLEQCYVQRWCGQFAGYTARNAAAIDVEYGIASGRFVQKTCPADAAYRVTAILKRLSLNAWIVTCPTAPRVR